MTEKILSEITKEIVDELPIGALTILALTKDLFFEVSNGRCSKIGLEEVIK